MLEIKTSSDNLSEIGEKIFTFSLRGGQREFAVTLASVCETILDKLTELEDELAALKQSLDE